LCFAEHQILLEKIFSFCQGRMLKPYNPCDAGAVGSVTRRLNADLLRAAQTRVERIAQAVAQEVEGEHDQEQGNSREDRLMGVAGN
jgi:hypothetical protein